MLPTQDELDLRIFQYKITKVLLKEALIKYLRAHDRYWLDVDEVMDRYDTIGYDVGCEMSQKVMVQHGTRGTQDEEEGT
jgi:hypothetical protein